MPPVTPFKIAIADEVLEDLRHRLARTRWPDAAPDDAVGEAQDLGTDLGYLRELTAYWRDGYDWRAREAALNRFAQFRTTIDGVDLHFIHEPGEGDAPYPLLLSHGWPGSIVEFQRLIPRLTHPSRFGGDPQDAFTIVAPSLPGYGFSYRPGQRRFSVEAIADVFAALMTQRLGYHRFAAHGHDWGGAITTRLGLARPDDLLGIHLALLPAPRAPVTSLTGGPLTPEEEAFNRQVSHWLAEETGYSQIMGTRPQTLSYGLTDSPVGLAAWIVEKFRVWSDCGGDVDRHFGRDTLLDNIMVYWVTGAINASFWPYYARLHGPPLFAPGQKVGVPMGYAESPREILTPPRSVAERYYGDIRRWTRMPKGGHFAALEDPAGLANEIQAFFRPLRTGELS